jgi:hypothetical protein
MLIVGYCFGIRSERRLCEEVHLNLRIRGFAGWDLLAQCPTTRPSRRTVTAVSSTAIGCGGYSRLFCSVDIDTGLVGGEGFAVDASLIQTDASDHNRVEGAGGLPPTAAGLPPTAAGRAVEEYLATLDDAAFGAASEVTPKSIAPANPATTVDCGASWTGVLRLFEQLSY